MSIHLVRFSLFSETQKNVFFKTLSLPEFYILYQPPLAHLRDNVPCILMLYSRGHCYTSFERLHHLLIQKQQILCFNHHSEPDVVFDQTHFPFCRLRITCGPMSSCRGHLGGVYKGKRVIWVPGAWALSDRPL